MSVVVALAVVRTVLVEGGSPELEVELRTNELTVCSAPCEARAIVRCERESECTVEVEGRKRIFSVLTRDDRVRLAESVRASLLELLPSEEAKAKPQVKIVIASPTRKAPATGTPPPAATQAGGRPFRAWEVSAGPSVAWQGGTTGFDVVGKVSWFPIRVLGINLEGTLPVTAGAVRGPGGFTSLASSVVGSSLTIRFVDDLVRLFASAGLAAAYVQTIGNADSGFVSTEDAKWTLLSFARLESGVNLGPHWFVPVSGSMGVGLPPADIAFAGRVVRQWAAPMIRLETGIGYAW